MQAMSQPQHRTDEGGGVDGVLLGFHMLQYFEKIRIRKLESL